MVVRRGAVHGVRLFLQPVSAVELPASTCTPWTGTDHQPVVLHRFEMRPQLRSGQPDDSPPVLCLALAGVPASAVMRLSVRRGQEVVYEVTSVRDARGGLLPAGRLVAAMASLADQQGLVVPAARLHLTLATAVVEVLARLGSNGAAFPARVWVTLPPA